MRKLLYVALAATLGLSACKKSDVEKDTKDPGQAKAGSTAQAANGLTALEAPEALLFFGGAESFNSSMGSLNKLVNQVVEAPPFSGMAGSQLQGEYRFKSVKGFDLTKAVKFAVFNRKVYRKNPLILCVGVKDKQAIKDALPSTGQKTDVEGNALSYLKSERSKRPVFINFIDDHACITRDVKIYPTNKDFVAQLLKAKIPHQGSVVFEMEHIMAAYEKKFEKGLAQAEGMIMMGVSASQMGNAQQTAAMFKEILKRVRVGAKSLKRAVVTLKIADSGALVDLKITPKAGGAAEGIFKALAVSGGHDLLAKLPADMPVFASAKFDAGKADKLIADLTTLSLAPIYGDKGIDPKYTKAIEDYMKALGGQMVFGVRPEDKDLGMVALFDVKDAKAARASQTTLFGMYEDPVLKAYYDTLGVNATYKQGAYEVGGVPVDTIKSEVKNMPPEAAMVMGLLGDMMTQHIAVGEKLAVVSYGAASEGIIKGYLTGSAEGGLDKASGVTHAIEHAATHPFALLYISPIDLVRRLKLGGMNTFAPMLKDVEATHGLTLSAGITGADLQIVIDVPTTLLKQGKAAFDKTKGAF